MTCLSVNQVALQLDKPSTYPFEEVRLRDDLLAEIDEMLALQESPVCWTSFCDDLLVRPVFVPTQCVIVINGRPGRATMNDPTSIAMF